MKFSTAIVLFTPWLIVSNASPLEQRGWLEPSSDANDWDSGKCAPVGVIFARGTFDSGNIGTWVGPQFLQPLQKAGMAIQGVDSKLYPATLQSYLSFAKGAGGGDGPKSLAASVTRYLDKCKGSSVVISGWSQGALVARTGYHLLDATHKTKVKAVVTFGDPITRFKNLKQDLGNLPPFPHNIGCNTENDSADPLCISIAEVKSLLGSTTVGSFTPTAILGPWLQIPKLSTGVQQTISLLKLVTKFLPQLKQALPQFLGAMTSLDTAAQLLLWPSHFFYGNNGKAAAAAKWVLELKDVQAAMHSTGPTLTKSQSLPNKKISKARRR